MSTRPDSVAFDPVSARRVEMTARCRDCDDVPKVADAGRVFDDPGGPVQVMHNGVRVRAGAYCGPWTTEIIRRLRGHHEPQEEKVFHELLGHISPGGTMVELGSFWAYYSLWFDAAVPNARTFLIEPDPGHLAVGRDHYTLNGRFGHFTHAAVGAASGPPVPFPCESDGTVRLIPTVSVDDFLDAHRLDRVDLLLCDIQGFETQMLVGATRSIARGALRFVVISTHHHTISNDPITHQEVLRLVREGGGTILVEHSVPESFSGDGLVVASFDPLDRSLPPIRISRNRGCEALFREVEFDLADTRRELAAARAELARLRSARVIRRVAAAARRRLGLAPTVGP